MHMPVQDPSSSAAVYYVGQGLLGHMQAAKVQLSTSSTIKTLYRSYRTASARLPV